MMGFFGRALEATIKVNADTKQAQNNFKMLASTVKTLIGAAVVRETIIWGKELNAIANEANAIEKSFNKLATGVGGNAKKMTESLKAVTMGMLDDIALQRNAIRALISGIDFNQFKIATEYITKYTASLGESAADLENNMASITQAMMTGRSISFKQFGIVVEGAGNVTKKAIDEMKKKIGELNISTEDGGVKALQLAASWDAAKEALAKDLVPVFQGMVVLLQANVFWLDKLISGTNNLFKTIASHAKGESDRDREISQLIEKSNLIKKEGESTKALNVLFEERGKVQSKIEELTNRRIRAEGILAKSIKDSDYSTKSFSRNLITDLDKLINQLEKDKSRLGVAMGSIVPGQKSVIPGTNPMTDDEKEEQKKVAEAYQKSLEDKGEISKTAFEKEQMLKDEQYNFSYERQQTAQQDELALYHEGKEKKLAEQAEADALLLDCEKKTNAEILDIKNKAHEAEMKDEEKLHEFIIAGYQEKKDLYPELENQINTLIEDENARHNAVIEDASKKSNDKILSERRALANEAYNLERTFTSGISDLINIQSQNEQNAINKKISGLDRKKMGEKAYQKEVERLQAEAAVKKKEAAIETKRIAEAQVLVDLIRGEIGVMADQTGGVATRILAGIGFAAAAAFEIAKLESVEYALGKPASRQYSRQPDTIPAMISPTESVINSPMTAKYYEAIRSIQNDTFDGRPGSAGPGITYNFFQASNEQVLEVTKQQRRRNSQGMPL